MAKLSKRVKEMKAKVDRNKVYAFDNAVALVKEFATAKFNESIDVAVQLGVDPKKSDQVVRGSVVLPAGTGKTVRVAVFAQGEKAEQAKAAGITKGSPKPHTDKVGTLTRAQAEEIAKTKQPDLTAADLDAAVRVIAGSARSMGITVEGI